MEAKLLLIPWMAAVIYSSIPLFWFAIHPFAARWRRMKRSPYRALLPLWALMIAGLALLTWPWHKVQIYYPPHSPWMLLAGVAGCLFAVGLRTYWRIRSSFGVENFIGERELRNDQGFERLVTTGMHAQVRHPIYLAHLVMMIAWTILSGLLVPFVLLAVSALVTFPAMIWLEEKELAQRFGPEYNAYRGRVPLFSFRFLLNERGDPSATAASKGTPSEI